MSKYRVHKKVVKSPAAILAAIEDCIVQRMLSHKRLMKDDPNYESALAEAKARAHSIVTEGVRVDLERRMPLYGYHGDMREERANIRIPRDLVNQWLSGGASNDAGFLKTDEGFSAIISDYDNGRWWSEAEARFTQVAAAYDAAEHASLNGYAVKVEENTEGMLEVICDSLYD